MRKSTSSTSAKKKQKRTHDGRSDSENKYKFIRATPGRPRLHIKPRRAGSDVESESEIPESDIRRIAYRGLGKEEAEKVLAGKGIKSKAILNDKKKQNKISLTGHFGRTLKRTPFISSTPSIKIAGYYATTPEDTPKNEKDPRKYQKPGTIAVLDLDKIRSKGSTVIDTTNEDVFNAHDLAKSMKLPNGYPKRATNAGDNAITSQEIAIDPKDGTISPQSILGTYNVEPNITQKEYERLRNSNRIAKPEFLGDYPMLPRAKRYQFRKTHKPNMYSFSEFRPTDAHPELIGVEFPEFLRFTPLGTSPSSSNSSSLGASSSSSNSSSSSSSSALPAQAYDEPSSPQPEKSVGRTISETIPWIGGTSIRWPGDGNKYQTGTLIPRSPYPMTAPFLQKPIIPPYVPSVYSRPSSSSSSSSASSSSAFQPLSASRSAMDPFEHKYDNYDEELKDGGHIKPSTYNRESLNNYMMQKIETQLILSAILNGILPK